MATTEFKAVVFNVEIQVTFKNGLPTRIFLGNDYAETSGFCFDYNEMSDAQQVAYKKAMEDSLKP